MAKNSILVSYLISKGVGRASGMRVWSDGQAEIRTGPEAWSKVAQLEPARIERLLEALRASGILKLPARLRAQEGVSDAPTCEWQASFEGHSVKAIVEGWTEQRSNELNLNKLMKQIYVEVSAAQMGAAQSNAS